MAERRKVATAKRVLIIGAGVVGNELCGEIQGSWTNYQLRGIWRPEDLVLQILCLPDIRIGKDKRTQAQELVSLVNEQMWLGHFDIWSNGGVLLYRNRLPRVLYGEL